jgi:photosystem II stability/assembly factor-like uncharacterized protein
MKKIITIVCLFYFASIMAHAQWQQINNGLYGGKVTCFTREKDTIFLGTWGGGIFYSTDNGSFWKECNNGLRSLNIYALTNRNGIIVAGTDSGKFSSYDNGINWMGAGFEPVTALFGGDNYLIVGTFGAIYFYNYSSTYNVNMANLHADVNINCIIMVESTIIVGTSGGIFISKDSSKHWMPVGGGDVRAFAKLEKDIYAGVIGGVYKSTDNGASWTQTKSNGLIDNEVSSITYSDNKLIIGTWGSGIYISSDYGENWTNVQTGPMDKNIMTLYTSGNNIYAGTFLQGVFISSDNGTSWNASIEGLTALNINKIAFYNNYLFACTFGQGMFRSSDFGNSWTQINNGLYQRGITALNVSSIDFKNPYIYIGTYGSGVFSSSDNGSSWIQTGSEISIQSITSLEIYNNIILAGTLGYGIYKSTNDGNNWLEANHGISEMNIYAIKTIGNNLYLSASDEIGSTDLYYTINNNLNWVRTKYCPPYDAPIADIIGFYNYLLLGTDGPGILSSSDNGNTWNVLSNDIPNASFPTLIYKDSILFTGTYLTGVYFTTDTGMTWKEDNLGLTNKNVKYLFIKGDSIYAATAGKGAYRANISNLFTSVDEINLNLDNDLFVFPNPANNSINLKIEGTGKNEKLTLYNLTGKIKTVFEGFLENGSQTIQVNLNDLSNGVYFIRHESNRKVYKLIVD